MGEDGEEIQEVLWTHPIEETETTPKPDVSETPQVTVGDVVTVEGPAFHSPTRAHPRAKLRYPRIPAETLRSLLSGKLIECTVNVGADGTAVADCRSSSRVPPFLIVWAKEVLERAKWAPATNDLGEPCPDEVPVVFSLETPPD